MRPAWGRVRVHPSPRSRSAEGADVDREPAVRRVVVEDARLVLRSVEEVLLQQRVCAPRCRGHAVRDHRVDDRVGLPLHLAEGWRVRLVVRGADSLHDPLEPGETVARSGASTPGLPDDRVEDLGLGRALGDRLGRDGGGLRRGGVDVLLAAEDAIVGVAARCAEGHANLLCCPLR